MANYKGDIAAGATLYFSFNTRDASGNPIVLAGAPVISVFKDAGTAAETTGVSLTVNNGQTGRHTVTISTASDATFFAAGHDYSVVITTGTVNGTSVVGVEVASFSINNRTEASVLTAVGAPLQASGYTAPPTVSAIQSGLATHTDATTIQAAITALGSPLQASGYTTPPTVAAIQSGLATHTDATTIQAAITALGSPAQASTLASDFATLVADISAIVTTSSGVVTGFTSGALSALAGLTITVQLPANISPSQRTIELTAGDDYLASINRSFNITFTGTLPDMTGGTAFIAFTSAKRVVRVIQMTIISASTSTLVIQVQLTAAQTAAFEPGAGTWEPQFTTAVGLKWSIPSTAENPWVLQIDQRPS